MICPNCQNICGESDRYCFRCGALLSESAKPKKGTHLVPVAILILLSVIGIVLFFSIPLTEPQSETPWFSVENGALYFDRNLYTGGSELTVPEIIDGQTIKHISDHCFENTDLTTVILPKTLQTIGTSAFSNCTAMRGIYLPEGMLRIDSHAFANCINLEAISIPSTVTSIGSGTFSGCEKLYYVFYNGEFSTWESLYSDHINIKTHIYCSDGPHLHR
jgi:hypothetical protein